MVCFPCGQFDSAQLIARGTGQVICPTALALAIFLPLDHSFASQNTSRAGSQTWALLIATKMHCSGGVIGAHELASCDNIVEVYLVVATKNLGKT